MWVPGKLVPKQCASKGCSEVLLHRGHTGRIAKAEMDISQGVPVCTVLEHPQRTTKAGSSRVVLECSTQGELQQDG